MPKLQPGTRLVVASHNPGKVREILDLVAPHGLSVVSAGELGLPEPEETGTTFAANAELKALAAAKGAGLPALSDDSGLEVEALDGAPGIYSARWAGPVQGLRHRHAPSCRRASSRRGLEPDAAGAARQLHGRAVPGLARWRGRRRSRARFTAIWSGRRADAEVSAMIRCSSPTATA